MSHTSCHCHRLARWPRSHPLTTATVVGQVGVTSRGQRRVTGGCPGKGLGVVAQPGVPPAPEPRCHRDGHRGANRHRLPQKLLSPRPPRPSREDPPALPARDKEQVVSKQGGGGGGGLAPGSWTPALGTVWLLSEQGSGGWATAAPCAGGTLGHPGLVALGTPPPCPPRDARGPLCWWGLALCPPASLSCLCLQPWFINNS